MHTHTPLLDRFKYHLLVVIAFAILLAALSYLLYPVDLLATPHDANGLLWHSVSATASNPGCIFTLLILIMGALWKAKLSHEAKMNALIHLGLLLVLSIGLKTLMKQVTHSPRPYTEVMAEAKVIASPRDFYTFNQEDKLNKIAKMQGIVSQWRWSNWQTEMNYAFPSGHTTFVTLCLLFFSRLFLSTKRYIWFAGLFCWALGVAYSRLWLGMHRPADLFGAIALENLIFLLVPCQYARLTPWLLQQSQALKAKYG